MTTRQPWVGLILAVLLVVTLPCSSSAFQTPIALPTAKTTPASRIGSSRLFSSGGGGGGFGSSNQNQNNNNNNNNNVKTSSPAGDFAYQEMVVLLTAMQKEGVTSRTMDPAKRQELEGYVRTVLVEQRGLPLPEIGSALIMEDPVTGDKSGSDWKLMFSTSDAVLESLPSDATVFLNVQDTTSLDYTLKFSKKTMGLDSLTAHCHYELDVSKPSNQSSNRSFVRFTCLYFLNYLFGNIDWVLTKLFPEFF